MRKLSGVMLLFLISCGTSKKETQVIKQENIKPKLEEWYGVKFTFDDGPSNLNTEKVLNILKQYNLQATFFIEGVNIDGKSEFSKERKEILKKTFNEGHIIGNHSYSHSDLCKLSPEKVKWEIDYTNKLVFDLIGFSPTLIRPPYGKKCKLLTFLLDERNMTSVYWDIDGSEWRRNEKTHKAKTKEEVLTDIIEQYKKLKFEQGLKHMILILHDTKNITVEILPDLLKEIEKINLTPHT